MKKTYMDSVHFWGRIWCWLALAVLLCVPLSISIHFDAWPDFKLVMTAFASVAIIYWPTSIIEVITYIPMLGAGGSYLSFITGNITNLKLPCGLNAMENAKVRATSEEGEVISTIAIGVSAITTTLVIAIGVLCFGPVLPKITADDSILKPAFEQVLPALFGALGASYLKKHWKISIFPILIGCLALLINSTMGIGILIVVTIVASVGGAFAMLKLKLV